MFPWLQPAARLAAPVLTGGIGCAEADSVHHEFFARLRGLRGIDLASVRVRSDCAA